LFRGKKIYQDISSLGAGRKRGTEQRQKERILELSQMYWLGQGGDGAFDQGEHYARIH
jgi:hypothetical protein